MTVVNFNNISGINSITAESNALNFYDSAGNTLSIGASVSGNITGNVTGNLTGNVNATGVSTFSGGVVVAAGSTAAPSISPSGDSNTGIFFPSPDTVAIGEGGVEALRVDSSGRVGINTITPSSPLDVVSDSNGLGFRLYGRASDSIGTLQFRDNANTTTYGYLQGRSTDLRIATATENPILFLTNNTSERCRITKDGQFLVGTSSTSTHAPSNLVVQRDQTWRCASNGSVSHHRIACARYTQGPGNRLVTFNVPVTAQFGGFACFMEVFMTAHRGYIDTAQSRMGKAYFSIARQGGGNSNVVITSNVGSQNWNGLTTTLGSSYTPRDLVTYITLTRAGSESSTETQAVGLELAAWDNVTVVGYISAIVDITVINETGRDFTWTIT